ncbi:MAG: hypothetical protein Q8L55_06630, partial [Phycisphaerales bacterium]|nr:hypothetical protein [Phycisphaerales bacterium]
MRIPGSKVYRAFAELDRFTDDQCRRFMKGVKRDWWVARVARWVAVGASFVIALVLCYGSSVYLVWRFIPPDGSRGATDTLYWVVLLLAMVTPVLIGLLSALLVRDWLLRRRLRAVINERARCIVCGYSMLGLAVPESLVVICPECGAPTDVDPALAELQVTSSGTVFRPTIKVSSRALTEKERRRRRRIAMTFVGAIVALLLTPVAIWGWNEWAIRRDARKAAAERPGAAGLLKVIATLPPSAGGTEASAWEEFEKVRLAIGEVDVRVWNNAEAAKDASGAPIRPDYGIVGDNLETVREEARAEIAASIAQAERMLPHLRAGGVFDKMRVMREAGDLTPGVALVAGQPLMNLLMPELAHCREMARINKARAVTALKGDDPAEFADALENVYALARMCEHKPFIIARLVSVAIDALGDGLAKRALMTRHDARWVDAVEAAMKRRTPRVPYAFTLNGERAFSLDSACVFFEDVARVRTKQWELLPRRIEGLKSDRVGRYDDAVAELNAMFDAGIAESQLEFHQRKPAVATQQSQMWIVSILSPALATAQRSVDQVEADRRGMRVMIALERYRIQNGSYPKNLSELVPTHLDAVPIDAWHGGPYLYRPLVAGSGPMNRGYLLYTRGHDRTDDGGKPGLFYLDALR